MNSHKKIKLANASRLLTVTEKGAKTATALFMFKTGSRNERRHNNGISHFLEHMFFKGSKNFPDTLTLSSALDSLGSQFNAFTSKEYTGYYIKTTGAKLEQALGILSDMMLHPLIDNKEIEREKGVIIEELKMYQDNPIIKIGDILENCLYGDTPAGWDIIGTIENIKKFKRADFIDYWQSQYGAESLNLVLTGDIKDKHLKQGENILKQFSSGHYRVQAELEEKQSQPQEMIEIKNTDQAVLALAVRAYPVNHQYELATRLLASILGGAMSSRLFINLRERQGLAYSVRTETEFYQNSGYLSTQAGVPKDKVSQAIKIILAEYKKLTKDLVPEQELNKAKDIAEGQLAIFLEASDNLANWYGRQLVYRDKIYSPQEYLKQLRQLEAEDLRQVAREIFKDERLNLAIIGDLKGKSFKPILKLN